LVLSLGFEKITHSEGLYSKNKVSTDLYFNLSKEDIGHKENNIVPVNIFLALLPISEKIFRAIMRFLEIWIMEYRNGFVSNAIFILNVVQVSLKTPECLVLWAGSFIKIL